MKSGLESNEPILPLWIGTGFHYALEDYHGYKHFNSATAAFLGFVEACKRTRGMSLPEDYEDGTELACAMLEYYDQYWLAQRYDYPTYVIDGIPQVEVTFKIKLPFDARSLGYPYDEVYYEGTFDRVATDEHGGIWIVEYKTAKSFTEFHFPTDQQCSSYCWAGEVVFERPIEGVIYQQHRKVIPDLPRVLSNGKISTASNMITCHPLYREALINLYGVVEKAPNANIKYLNALAAAEDEDRDVYIRRDIVTRNAHQLAAEGAKILMECEDILNPNLALYPNPTRECHFCPFVNPCISLDDGGDCEAELAEITKQRGEDYNPWRPQIQLPSQLQ